MNDAIPLDLDLQYCPVLNFAMEQNDVPFVRGASIFNPGATALGPCRLRLTTTPEVTRPLEIPLSALAPGETLELGTDRVNPHILRDPLVRLEERERGTLHAVLLDPAGAELLHRTLAFDLLAYNEWMGVGQLREILAAFVMPNHPQVETLLPTVVECLRERTGQTALDGYQTGDFAYVREQIAAIYDTLARQGLAYANPPASFERTGQKIRTPEQIRSAGVATCLDSAVLMAALLEHVGLAPLLLLKEGHAWVGIWLHDASFDEAVIPSAVAVKARCALDEILVVETTGTTASPPLPFAEACVQGLAHLRQISSFHYALDVRMARRMGIRPMPARLRGDVAILPPNAPPQPTVPMDAPSPPTAPDEPDPAASPESVSRLERWKRHLLDLSRRNRLLNFRESRASILLACPDLATLEDALAAGDEFTVLPSPKQLEDDPRDAALHRQRTGDDLVGAFLIQQMREKRLHSTHPAAELELRMREMDRAARLSLEESGANTLFLALGFLRWREDGKEDTESLAPVILLPMRIDRRSVRRGFRVSMVDEEARINVTLLRKLEADFDIRIGGLDPLPTDESGLDLSGILRRVRQAVKHKDNWEVVENAALAIFTFTKFLMWADLEMNTEALKRSPLVRHLIETPAEPFPAKPVPPVDLDALDPASLLTPLDADSSQLQAVVAAGNGASFVLQGPPGTGKSQTITNLIAHCLAAGRRVLFVSEKMAALNVVQHRLATVGLGPFCLELHSHKSTKHDFRRQLEEAMELGRFAEPELWCRRTAQLAQRRDELNAYVQTMHAPRAFGENILWACERWVEHRALPDQPLELGALDAVGADALDELLATARRLRDDATHCKLGPEHPLRDVTVPEWTPGLAPQMRKATAALREAADELVAVAGRALQPLRLGSAAWSRFALEFGAELSGLLLEAPSVSADLLRVPDWDGEAFESLFEIGRRRDRLRSLLREVYGDAYAALPLERLRERLHRREQAALPLRWWHGFLARRIFRKAMTVPIRRSFAEFAADLSAAFDLRECEKSVATSPLAALFGEHWRSGEPDWEQLSIQVAWAERFRAAIRTPDFANPEDEIAARDLWLEMATQNREATRPDGALGKGFARYLGAFGRFAAAREDLAGLMLPSLGSEWSDAMLADCPAVSVRLADRWLGAQSELRAWCAWLGARARALSLGLDAIVAALERAELAPDAVPSTVEKAFARWVLEQALATEPALKGFAGVELNHVIEEFRRADEEVRQLACQALFARLSARLPESNGDEDRLRSSEMGRLKRFAKGGRRSIRQVFRECPNALSLLKPCVLMSPLSVAQFLGPEFPPFDLVVFDEASQMPPWEAIGAIARGNSVIVVGDSKQLPPTSFFQRGPEEQELLNEEDLEDMESILDECVACQLPTRTLSWHYRSRHESLIAFSNYHYYDNRLSTFPSPERDPARLGVSWHPVPGGFYDAGRSRTNRAEAEAIVAEIVSRLRDPVRASHSVGVVTFSMSQQRLVEDLLEQARAENPGIDPYFSDRVAEPVFVKNLETVQGDERDAILFSVCYGPNRDGKVAMNFGPLNNKGGERRLNVAVTRARRQLLVFSTLRAEQIDLQRTHAVGVAHLKSFLEFAAKGMPGMRDAASGEQAAAPVALALRRALAERNWEVECEVGSSGCRVAIAVRHPDRPESFLLGIDVESQAQGQAGCARDRNRLREAVLENLGWRLLRIWALDWCFDEARELGRVEAALQKALDEFRPTDQRETPGGNQPVNEDPESDGESLSMHERLRSDLVPIDDEDTDADGASAYQVATLAPDEGGSEAFHSAAADARIVDRIVQVLQAEAPIAPELLARRVAACWGIGRLSRKVVDRVFALVPMRRIRLTESGDRQFVWRRAQAPDSYAEYRVPSSPDEPPRNAEHVCPQEVANAMAAGLARHLSLSEDDLLRTTAAVFGFARVGSRVKEAMQAGLDLLLARRSATVVDGMVSLAAPAAQTEDAPR